MTTNIQRERTALPIETVYFQEDVANKVCTVNGVQQLQPIYDPAHWNRYYFNYPPEWKTTNNADPIIGVRSIWLMNNKRRFKFILCIRKYSKWHFISLVKNLYPDRYNDNNLQNPRDLDENELTDEEIDNVVKQMSADFISHCFITIECEITRSEDFGKLRRHTIKCWKQFIKAVNNENSGWIFNSNPRFVQEDINQEYGGKNIDLNIEDIYHDNKFTVNFNIPRNAYYFNDSTLDCYVDFAIVPHVLTFFSIYDDNFQLLDDRFQLLPLDPDINRFDDEFNEVFNIGNEPFQNSVEYLAHFHRNIEFKNLWDRHECKVCASFASQSNHYYIGNSHVRFDPIKYYRLNSNDDKFWIEFYNDRNPNIPMKLPKHEGFVIEMQFMQDDKFLYI